MVNVDQDIENEEETNEEEVTVTFLEDTDGQRSFRIEPNMTPFFDHFATTRSFVIQYKGEFGIM